MPSIIGLPGGATASGGRNDHARCLRPDRDGGSWGSRKTGALVMQAQIEVETRGQGTFEITDRVARFVASQGSVQGLVHVFCAHTSCSLILMENADPSARRDLERWLNRLVPEDDRDFQHTAEGPDDMPSHIKMALTRSSELIPINGGRLLLGTWQGIFLWEHRRRPHRRTITLTVLPAG